MKQFIDLFGFDDNDVKVDVCVCVDKITFMKEIYGDEQLSSRIYFAKDVWVSVEETISEIKDLINSEEEVS